MGVRAILKEKNPPGGLVRKEECLKFLNNEYLYKLSDGINSLG